MTKLPGYHRRFRDAAEIAKSAAPPILRWFCIGHLFAVSLLAQCTYDSQSYTSGSYTLLSNTCITSTSVIGGSASVVFQAGTSINLQSGFHAVAGTAPTTFRAIIVSLPSITGVTPTSGTSGAQITVSGSGFGASRGAGTIWLGSTLGVVVSWSDTQIVATVASNAMSGSALVHQNGAWSNAVAFNVATAAISSIAPSSGLPGTQVTITGSGFGAAQGTGQVWIGTTNAVVQSWSDIQVVALVASGSLSGRAQVLQNGVWSNAVVFGVNTPHITSLTPSSGAPGTSVTISGTGFGTSQGSGAVQLGNIAGLVNTWSETQIVATVASSALTGIVRIQQNSVLSNALSFVVSGGTSLILSPNLLNMVVGDTHTIQALDSNGQPVTGLTWTSSDSAVVSLSSDDPPLLTALAAGHVTITAGTATADVTVVASSSDLSLGTVLWSVPGSFESIVPAVPSVGGVADVFAFEYDGDGQPVGNIQAITSEGVTAWTADASLAAAVVPDFQGGLVLAKFVQNNHPHVASIVKLDGITGQPSSTYTAASGMGFWNAQPVAVHTDGTIFVGLDTDISSDPPGPSVVIGIDPSTGAEKFRVPLTGRPVAGPMIAGDGCAYIAYMNGEPDSDPYSYNEHLMLMRLNSDGTSENIHIQDFIPSSDKAVVGRGATMITNADTGIVLTWAIGIAPVPDSPLPDPVEMTYGMAITTGTSVSLFSGPTVPGQGFDEVAPIVQTQDGSFVGEVNVGLNADASAYLYNMVAFDATGTVRWIVPNEQPQIATADGGVIGKSGITYDQNGNATGQTTIAIQSWRGNMYRIGSVEQIAFTPLLMALTLWAQAGGSPSQNATAGRSWEFKLVWQNNCATETQPCGFTIYPDNPSNVPSLRVDASSMATNIKSAALAALRKAFDSYPAKVTEGTSNSGDHQVVVLDGYVPNPNPGHTGEVLCGSTINPTTSSKAYYRPHMENAQWDLSIQIQTQQDAQNAVGREDYIKAIGTGIGNTAAHEIGHQFFNLASGMEDSSQNTYNGAGCGNPWNSGVGPIQWGTVTQNAWKSALGTGWHQ